MFIVRFLFCNLNKAYIAYSVFSVKKFRYDIGAIRSYYHPISFKILKN